MEGALVRKEAIKMNALFEIASAVRTPLALAGIVVVVLYLLFRAI